jgi:hypothetical protein
MLLLNIPPPLNTLFPGGKRPLGRPGSTPEVNIKINSRETGWSGMDWIHLAEDMGQWKTLMKTILKFRVPQNGKFLTNCAASQVGLSSMELVVTYSQNYQVR